jgi:hypothetical protein
LKFPEQSLDDSLFSKIINKIKSAWLSFISFFRQLFFEKKQEEMQVPPAQTVHPGPSACSSVKILEETAPTKAETPEVSHELVLVEQVLSQEVSNSIQLSNEIELDEDRVLMPEEQARIARQVYSILLFRDLFGYLSQAPESSNAIIVNPDIEYERENNFKCSNLGIVMGLFAALVFVYSFSTSLLADKSIHNSFS